jgi:hypothetical protein
VDAPALSNVESRALNHCRAAHLKPANIGAHRTLPQPSLEVIELRSRSVGMHLYPAIVQIPGPSGDSQIPRGALREVAKPYSLDAPGNEVLASFKPFHPQ